MLDTDSTSELSIEPSSDESAGLSGFFVYGAGERKRAAALGDFAEASLNSGAAFCTCNGSG